MIDFLEKEFKVKNYLLAKIDGKFLEKYFQYQQRPSQKQTNLSH